MINAVQINLKKTLAFMGKLLHYFAKLLFFKRLVFAGVVIRSAFECYNLTV